LSDQFGIQWHAANICIRTKIYSLNTMLLKLFTIDSIDLSYRVSSMTVQLHSSLRLNTGTTYEGHADSQKIIIDGSKLQRWMP